MVKETHTRSLAKAITWRVINVILDFSLAFFLTGKVDFAAKFSIISLFLTTILYFFHERAWNQTHWGRRSLP